MEVQKKGKKETTMKEGTTVSDIDIDAEMEVEMKGKKETLVKEGVTVSDVDIKAQIGESSVEESIIGNTEGKHWFTGSKSETHLDEVPEKVSA